MTLTTRHSLFFLTTLALVLAGFSATLYLVAGKYLRRQTEERLEAALNTLVAAAEVGPDGLEWEPAERHLRLGTGALGDQVSWLVRDDRGRPVDGSTKPAAGGFWEQANKLVPPGQPHTTRLVWQGESWQVSQRWLQAPSAEPGQDAVPPADSAKAGRKYRGLAIAAAMSLEPVLATLRLLGLTLAGISLATWLVALLAGRLVSRWSLLPVTRMAKATRAMDAANVGGRLPIAATGDEIEDLGSSFNSLLDRFQELIERQRRFTGDASHQLRTPLAAVLGQIEVALRRERDPEEYRRVLTTVHGQANQLKRIVESLLFLARAESEAPLPGRERLDLAQWLPAHFVTLAGLPRATDTRVDVGEVGPASVVVHPVLLGELLNILLDNAWKYSPSGTPVTVRLRCDGNMVELSVLDQGAGIREDDLPHIFSPFFRSADSLRLGVEGVGLGLSIARRLALACGGVLTATSQKGQGSCFKLELPGKIDDGHIL